MKQSKGSPTRRELASLKRQLERLNITQQRVADTAGVGFTTVCNVLAGRRVSANVVATAKRLIADAKARPATGEKPNPHRTPQPRSKAG